MARDRFSISRWPALALATCILLNGVLLVLFNRAWHHPTGSVPNSAHTANDTPTATPAKIEPRRSRVVMEGLPKGIRAVLRGHHGLGPDSRGRLSYIQDNESTGLINGFFRGAKGPVRATITSRSS